MLELLVAARAIHFAATILATGAVLFSVLVAEPLWHRPGLLPATLRPCRRRIALILALGLSVAIVSGSVQLIFIAAEVADESLAEVLGDGTAWTLLTDTQFGAIAQGRLLLALALGGLFLPSALKGDPASSWARMLAAVVAVVFLGLLSWTGHAAGATGIGASTHLLSDLIHTLAAGAWVGGLLPLALFLHLAGRAGDHPTLEACVQTLRRFSALGVASVSALLVTGFINTWFLTDHLRELFGSDYGSLVLTKVGLFLAMLCLAAVNRLRLAPAIARAQGADGSPARALRRLWRNTVLEIALGLVVLYVVGALGMTPPAGHNHG